MMATAPVTDARVPRAASPSITRGRDLASRAACGQTTWGSVSRLVEPSCTNDGAAGNRG